MPPCLFSHGADMATKEENQKHLRQLAGLLGREADMSGSAADIAQRVSEWEEELAASREGIMPGDESGPEQNHTDDGEQLHGADGEVYALAQGSVVVGGMNATGASG